MVDADGDGDGDGDGGRRVSCPSYLLTLSSDTDHVFVSIHQKDCRSKSGRPYIDIGVTVLQVDPSSEFGLRVVASTGSTCDRQVQTNSLSLSAGQYVIVPTSTGCKLSSVSIHTIICVCVCVCDITACIALLCSPIRRKPIHCRTRIRNLPIPT